MAAEILVATRSNDKLEEIREILAPTLRAKLITLADLGVPAAPEEDDIENFPTCIENALAKAHYFSRLTNMPTLADDSGLVVNALNGGPGVRTKRFAIDNGAVSSDVGGKALDAANNRLLLSKLERENERSAHYVCAAAYVNGSAVASALGTCSGSIAQEEVGDGGFGYDPLFYIEDLSVTFAQLTRAQKNSRSHRARAFRALASQIK